MGILIIPLGVGIFIFRDLITDVLLGSQWIEAANFIGLWALTSAVTIVLSHYSSEVYRSLGKPKLSVLSQFLHLIVLCPVMLIAVRYTFDVIYMTRAFVRLELVLVNLLLMYAFMKISPWRMCANIFPSILAAFAMGIIGYFLLGFSSSIMWNIISFLFVYFAISLLLPYSDKKEPLSFLLNTKYVGGDFFLVMIKLV